MSVVGEGARGFVFLEYAVASLKTLHRFLFLAHEGTAGGGRDPCPGACGVIVVSFARLLILPWARGSTGKVLQLGLSLTHC